MDPIRNALTHSTHWTIDEAIGWLDYQATRHTTGWSDRCLGITANAFGYQGSGTISQHGAGKTGWAIEQWNESPSAWKHPGKFLNVPRGGIIHWEGGQGHTGTSNGDGNFWGNDITWADHITLAPISLVKERWGLNMVGWRDPSFIHGNGTNAPKRGAIIDPYIAWYAAQHPKPIHGNPAWGPYRNGKRIYAKDAVAGKVNDSVWNLTLALAERGYLLNPSVMFTHSVTLALAKFQYKQGFRGTSARGVANLATVYRLGCSFWT